MKSEEFVVRARLTYTTLETWVEAGWLLPDRAGPAPEFSDVDLARAQLIHDLTHDLGVNDEGVAIILDLVDQMHGLRHTLREVLKTSTTTSEP
jgi:chaperone modulatory protein CbpM